MVTRISEKLETLGMDIGLLILRLSFGGLMLTHGIPKLMAFGERSSNFKDPLGIGSPASLSLAIFAEVVCSILLMAGVVTRFAASQLIITMFVAAFIVHGPDPFGRKELAIVYLAGYLGLILTGAGRFSVDRLLFKSDPTSQLEDEAKAA